MDGAEADFMKAIALEPRFASAYYHLGLLKHAKGQLQEAIGYYDTALGLDDREAAFYYQRAEASYGLG